MGLSIYGRDVTPGTQQASPHPHASTRRRNGMTLIWRQSAARGRVLVRLHRAGMVLALLTLALGIAAVNSGNNILFLLVSFLLALFILSGVLAVLNVRGLDLQWLEPPVLSAGEIGHIGFHLVNRGAWPAFLLDLRLGQERLQVPVLPSRSSRTLWLAWTPPHRGHPEWPSLVLGSAFPFGFIWRGRMQPAPYPAVVAPMPAPLAPPLPRGPQGHAADAALGMGHGEWAGIRDYRLGEGLGAVVWRKVDWVARAAQRQTAPLPARHYAAENAGEVLLDWYAPLLANMTDEMRLTILRSWLDQALAARLPWRMRLREVECQGIGTQGRMAALQALALQPPLPVSLVKNRSSGWPWWRRSGKERV